MTYYKSLLEYVQVLEREGLLFRVNKPINKDTEMHPLVRWQFRGLGEEQRKAFYFDDIYDAKGKKYDIPVLIGGLAGSQRIYALGLNVQRRRGRANLDERIGKTDRPHSCGQR